MRRRGGSIDISAAKASATGGGSDIG